MNLDNIINFLKAKKNPISFDDIWEHISKDIDESTKTPEYTIKANLFSSMIIDERLLMISDNKWDLRNRYTLDEVERINKISFSDSEDVEKELDKTIEETIEISVVDIEETKK